MKITVLSRNLSERNIAYTNLIEGTLILSLAVGITSFFIFFNDYNPMQLNGHLKVTAFFVFVHLAFALLISLLLINRVISQDFHWGLLFSVIISLSIAKRLTIMDGLPGSIGWNSRGTGDYFEIIKMSKLSFSEILDIEYPPLYPLVIKIFAFVSNYPEELITKRILLVFAYSSYLVLYFFIKSQFNSFVAFVVSGTYISLSDDIDATYKSLSYILFFAFFILFYQNLVKDYKHSYYLIFTLFLISVVSYFGALYFYFHATLVLFIMWIFKYAKWLGLFFVVTIIISPSIREVFSFLFFHQSVFLYDKYEQILAQSNYPFSIYMTFFSLAVLLGLVFARDIFFKNRAFLYPLLILSSNSFLVQLIIIYGVSKSGYIELWPRGGGLTLTLLFSIPMFLTLIFISNQLKDFRKSDIFILSSLLAIIFITLETQEFFKLLPLNNKNLHQIYQDFFIQ